MNQKKIKLMQEGGQLLASIKTQLGSMVKPGVTPLDIERHANKLISQTGGQPSFKLVPNYHHATCVNVNDSLVHGIPTKQPFNNGDLVSIDLGLYYKGYHTDTSITVVAGSSSPKLQTFINVGYKALDAAIKAAIPGNRVSDISRAVQTTIETAGYSVIRDLTGHGIGTKLHEDPYIPNFVDPNHHDSTLYSGQTIAIEPMYSMGDYQIKIESDDWTISSLDGSLTALVEDTIAITPEGPVILTR